MAMEWASTAVRVSRSSTVWTARAPATRVTGSMLHSRSRGGAARAPALDRERALALRTKSLGSATATA